MNPAVTINVTLLESVCSSLKESSATIGGYILANHNNALLGEISISETAIGSAQNIIQGWKRPQSSGTNTKSVECISKPKVAKITTFASNSNLQPPIQNAR